MKTLVLIFVMLISSLGPSIVIALVGYASVQGLSRNPSASSKILITMILSFIFAEAIAVISLLSVLNSL
ncbi:MAG: ATP synthase F0 subunit C [Candidatus Omnitrophica bacterium]|nr:ATP synthase F0 subunit C [Candidatus Omnitrophota bacterium]MBU1895128.1 ATP synthase F0 subunit C [Candidatus Omnitrophota bacterium]